MKEKEKYFQQKDPMRSNDIDDILTSDEKVLWRGKPKKSAYIISAVMKMLPFVILWLAIDVTIIVFMATRLEGVPWFLWLFFAVHLAPVWIWIFNIVHSAAEVGNIRYVVTDKRIIIRRGVIIDLKFMYFAEITNVTVRVGLTDRMLKVGDIYITAETQRAVLYDIADPYYIANELQAIVRDIKADTFFPNALRPEVNRGYNTEYEGERFKKTK